MFKVKVFEPHLVRKSELCGLVQYYDVDENAKDVEKRMYTWIAENKVIPILVERQEFAYHDFVMPESRFCLHYKDNINNVTK